MLGELVSRGDWDAKEEEEEEEEKDDWEEWVE
jgi:hypothetical protein